MYLLRSGSILGIIVRSSPLTSRKSPEAIEKSPRPTQKYTNGLIFWWIHQMFSSICVKNYFLVWAVEKENKLLIVSKQIWTSFWPHYELPNIFCTKITYALTTEKSVRKQKIGNLIPKSLIKVFRTQYEIFLIGIFCIKMSKDIWIKSTHLTKENMYLL